MRYGLLFTFWKQAVGLVVAIIVYSIYHHSTPAAVSFETCQELKDFIESHGLYHHSGTKTFVPPGNSYICDHPVGFEDLAPVMTRRDCGNTPAWRGILWVAQIRDPGWVNALRGDAPSNCKCRIWGKVLVVGDEDLMDRIEILAQKQR